MKTRKIAAKRILLGSGLALLLLLALSNLPGRAATPDLPEALKSEADGQMTLVDFYSPYCGTCRMMAPHLSRLEEKIQGQIRMQHLDVANPDNQSYAERYDIQATPTYILFDENGQAVYRMADLISPAVLERQMLRTIGRLEAVEFPEDIPLPATDLKAENPMQDLLLVSFENKDCKPCQTMSPYLAGFQMAGQEGLRILKLDTETPGGKQMVKTLAIKKLPTYVLFDNHPGQDASQRGELFRMEGEVQPRTLWDLIRAFGQAGV